MGMVAAAMKGMATATTTTTTWAFTTTGLTGQTGPTLGESSRVCLGAFSTTAGRSTNPERATSHLPPKMESTSDNNKPLILRRIPAQVHDTDIHALILSKVFILYAT